MTIKGFKTIRDASKTVQNDCSDARYLRRKQSWIQQPARECMLDVIITVVLQWSECVLYSMVLSKTGTTTQVYSVNYVYSSILGLIGQLRDFKNFDSRKVLLLGHEVGCNFRVQNPASNFDFKHYST